MKSFIRAITITIVFTLIMTGSARTQVTPAPVQTTPGAAIQEQIIKEANKTDDVMQKLIQLIATTGQYDGGRILVIPTAEIQPQDLVTMMEDMNVMCRIFDKRLEQSNLIPKQVFSSNIRLSTHFSRYIGSTGTGAMYIQGYGTLFLTNVDFLLSPPPEVPEEKKTEEEDTDPLWTQMRQEIYAPEEVERRKTDDRPEEKYDAEKVENLKTTLIKTLKHAANIRGLKPDESVIFTVTGKTGQSATTLVTRVRVSTDGQYKYITTEPAGAGSVSLSPTVLTIRAKKADIDAFAKGQYDFDQFRQRTQLLLYPFLGASVGGPSRSSPTGGLYGGSSNRRIIR